MHAESSHNWLNWANYCCKMWCTTATYKGSYKGLILTGTVLFGLPGLIGPVIVTCLSSITAASFMSSGLEMVVSGNILLIIWPNQRYACFAGKPVGTTLRSLPWIYCFKTTLNSLGYAIYMPFTHLIYTWRDTLHDGFQHWLIHRTAISASLDNSLLGI